MAFSEFFFPHLGDFVFELFILMITSVRCRTEQPFQIIYFYSNGFHWSCWSYIFFHWWKGVTLFVVTIESTGALPPEVLFTEAVKILEDKCERVITELSWFFDLRGTTACGCLKEDGGLKLFILSTFITNIFPRLLRSEEENLNRIGSSIGSSLLKEENEDKKWTVFLCFLSC